MTLAAGSLSMWKGHGTENDFVLIDDRDGTVELGAALARALCNRRTGIGADGVLRVVRCAAEPAAASMAASAPFFMDYRNADGSLAEMCGNGIRLFALYLQSAGLIAGEVAIATRGGIRQVWLESPAAITVEMGAPTLLDVKPLVTAHRSSWSVAAVALQVPNPHVVVDVGSMSVLDELDLTVVPRVDPGLPDGQNVEFVARTGPRQLAMRVHERGSGETRSCGTGICAAVVAIAMASVEEGPANDGSSWQVDVPGGRCAVQWRPDGQLRLTGPAQLVARVEPIAQWLSRVDEN